jgi:cysteine desulfurase
MKKINKMKNIYLDHSATTPMDATVFEEIKPFLMDDFGNASSIHNYGMVASEAISKARQQVADFVNGTAEEIIFTSGATESDNLAIFGVAERLQKDGGDLKDLHFITTSVEHPAVEEPFLKLKEQGAEITFLPVQSNGVVKMEDVRKAVKENTVFISMVYVNSEVGAKQPIQEVGELIKAIKKERKEAGNNRPLIFHTDAVQAANFFNCNVDKLGVDLLSLSGHKVYGPKGVGALYVRKGTKLTGQQIGGHQENNLRSGTYNTVGIVGMGKALELVTEGQDENNKHLRELQNILIEGIKEKIPQSFLSTDIKNATPSHVHFSFPGAEGEAVLMELDMEGICISTGSACASASLQSSPTLLAMNVPKEVTHGAIRMTLGKHNTKDDIEKVLEVLPRVIKKYRAMSPKNIDYGAARF